MTSTISSKNFQEGAKKQALQRGKMELLTSVMGFQALNQHRKMSQANQEAENRQIRKKVWGSDIEVPQEEEEEMGNIHLGDTNNPAPIIVPQAAAVAGLGPLPTIALMAATAFGTWFLSQQNDKEQVDPQPQTDETVVIGLGRIEDYLKENP